MFCILFIVIERNHFLGLDKTQTEAQKFLHYVCSLKKIGYLGENLPLNFHYIESRLYIVHTRKTKMTI